MARLSQVHRSWLGYSFVFKQHLELIITGSVVSENVLPSFTWDSVDNSSYGVPQLIIHFPDGGANDSALLNWFNPIPAEDHETVDKCIFRGQLRDENVAVNLTGGCPFSNSFEVRYFVKLKLFDWQKLYVKFYGTKPKVNIFHDLQKHFNGW